MVLELLLEEEDSLWIYQYRARRNGLCYLCGLKGHLARDCPQRKTQIRSILMCMEPEERQAWADKVDCLKESELAEVEQDFGQA